MVRLPPRAARTRRLQRCRKPNPASVRQCATAEVWAPVVRLGGRSGRTTWEPSRQVETSDDEPPGGAYRTSSCRAGRSSTNDGAAATEAFRYPMDSRRSMISSAASFALTAVVSSRRSASRGSS